MSDAAERRIRRAEGQRLLDDLAADYSGRAGVDRALMFGSTGLRIGGKFFAFVGADGDLIVKVPAVRAAAVRAHGEASPVQVGRNATREWISVPATAVEGPAGLWREVLSDAYHHVASSSVAPTGVSTQATVVPDTSCD